MPIQYLAVIVGGMLAGIGGAQLSTAYANAWFENMAQGRGFIAVAVVIFAARQPFKVAGRRLPVRRRAGAVARAPGPRATASTSSPSTPSPTSSPSSSCAPRPAAPRRGPRRAQEVFESRHGLTWPRHPRHRTAEPRRRTSRRGRHTLLDRRAHVACSRRAARSATPATRRRPPASGAATTAAAVGGGTGDADARAPAARTIGFIFVGPKDDFGYNQAAYEGSQAVAEGVPRPEVLTAENVPEDDNADPGHGGA